MDKSNLGTKTNVRMTMVFAIVVITLCCANFIDAASMAYSEKNFGAPLHAAGKTRIERNVNTCQNTPCGWAVYDTNTRNILYYMKNTCICDQGQTCVRVRDDLSARAYEYLCRDHVTPDDITHPEDSN